MPEIIDIKLAIKCPPEEKILLDAKKAGLKGVELYLSRRILADISKTVGLCKNFPLWYAVHAPHDEYDPSKLSELVTAIGAEIVVFHNIYWEDEWKDIVGNFKDIKTKLCIENVFGVHEPLKFARRYGLYRCLDLEHLQMECAGVYEEEFITVMKQASHIHLTGYIYGSDLWHTHIHHSPGHGLRLLNVLKEVGYSGFVVSEAKASLQTYEEFKRLNDFFKSWKDSRRT